MDTEIKFDNDDEGVLYWVILNDDESSLAFMCQAYGTERLEFLQKYKETAKTLKLQ